MEYSKNTSLFLDYYFILNSNHITFCLKCHSLLYCSNVTHPLDFVIVIYIFHYYMIYIVCVCVRVSNILKNIS